jgi:PiT family inorganic phosphate transporter
MDLMQVAKKMEKEAIKGSSVDFFRLGFALFFMVAVLTYSFLSTGGIPNSMFLAIAALFGAYMAMNIGANDVANNVGPAVGSKALTMGGAIVIAAIFEAGGAFIAGGDVIKTIKKGIIDIDAFGGNVDPFIWAMMSALLAAYLGNDVSTFSRCIMAEFCNHNESTCLYNTLHSRRCNGCWYCISRFQYRRVGHYG